MRILDQGRHSLATKVWSIRRRRSDPRQVRDYLATHEVRLLQIGTGTNPLPGWLNTDLRPDLYPRIRDRVIRLDARFPFPLPDSTFDYVASEHQIQCLPVTEGSDMLRECFRILRPGGRIRIATPNLTSITGLCSDHPDDAQRYYMSWIMRRYFPGVRTDRPQSYVINQMFHAYGHQFIYDRPTLTALLREAGFTDITSWAPGESSDAALRGADQHGQALRDDAVNRFETMVLEAVRPAAG
jgi:predicted SAM-dependent methyltransferase